MASDNRETLRQTFEQVADLYDRARPGYPDRLFADLFAAADIEPGSFVLEIGCGTGQASRPLAARGCRLLCVELGENLAAVARRNLAGFRNAQVEVGRFETWNPPTTPYDMVFAATSWHWLDPAARYVKAGSILKPAGVLAIIRSEHAFPEGFDPFFTEIQPCYDAIGESHGDWPPPPPEAMPDYREEIERSGLFEDVHTERYLWTVDYTADEYTDVLNTYSGHIMMSPPHRATLFAEIRRLIRARPDGRIRKHYLSILHIARRCAYEHPVDRVEKK